MNAPSGVKLWSAVPTPLTPDFKVDGPSVEKMIRQAVADGMQGVFLAGTCGEGPWLPDRERRRLIQLAVAAAAGRTKIAAQVSDNSVPRILDNVALAAEAGADYGIIAAPATMLNATPERIAGLFEEAATASPLPVGIYDLGPHRPVMIPEDRLKALYLLANVHFVKDSSGAPGRRSQALAARREKPTLDLFNGDEFRCFEYLEAGYNGCMFGGAVAVAPQMARIAVLFEAGRRDEARALDAEMRSTLFGIYGGEKIACWLSGLKHYMVRRGIFSFDTSFLGYPLTDECRRFIQDYLARPDLGRVAVN
jgi:dihydrodipicolinate synthase/N-acetylneuraminate lyase